MRSISRRILAVNVFALAVLVAGLLFVGQYRQGLIDNEIAALTIQAEMFAAALGEAAVAEAAGGSGVSSKQTILADIAGQIVRRLADATHTQARLVLKDGSVVTDSRIRVGPGGAVQVEDLPPPIKTDGDLVRRALDLYDRIATKILPADTGLSAPGTAPGETPKRALSRAFNGENGFAISRGSGGHMAVSVAVPVQRYKRVLAALSLNKDTRRIDEAVFQVRLDILKVFGIALLITVLLSVYLAGTIARPLARLAEAADHVRRGLARQYSLPDMGRRHDEIGALGGALKDMTEALWQRMDAIEGFAADVAHEIKNPLTSLRSAVETWVRIDDPAQQRKLVSIIQNDIERLDRLITDISNASRVDAEMSRAEMTPVDVGAILVALAEIHQASGEARHVEIDLDIAAGPALIIEGVEDRIVQVMRNLISNAVSFSPEGGRIRISASRDDGTVLITISDDGPGIPPGSEAAVFERFYRERPAAEKFGTHSGLGLSISQQIVTAHGGDIWAENRTAPGGAILGARFIVRFALAK
ncbi:MAG: HAMP domain-containing protein [Rhodospirillaceae bacterium]|nr:HAMP domain-containing protein [Rhodospirillaceae bacterium]MBT4719779.1 HAMP domain-containing protein [Rhodospirillaceae bacterium]MBT5180191.1 HAMP domain-containing protein [Rhodospirillaceae bacterium]MBT5841068.1 HAMP domain-containing protein [Rhodospirillaceae bacterium]